MAETGVSRKSSQSNFGGYITGVQDKMERKGHTVGDVIRDIRDKHVVGWIFWDGYR